MSQASNFRSIPSVEIVTKELYADQSHGLPRALTVEIVRRELANIRRDVASAGATDAPPISTDQAIDRCRRAIGSVCFTRISPVINATGVILHTNLGRSPLSNSVAQRTAQIASSYCNVELDLQSGKRGPRAGFLELCLSILCDAPAATVTNNCAAGLILALRHFVCSEKPEVIVSRGELVEIGGGFRVPEIMEQSGAKLVEVGTTNKTRLSDYENAITDRTCLILRVHRSNFSMEGFVSSPNETELAALSKRSGVPYIEDLGSGAMMATDKLAPIEHEPTPIQLLAAGAALVCFSGDKLLGGPQAGIIAGQSEHIKGIKRDPLYRAIRPDKVILSILQETAIEYLRAQDATPETLPDIPAIRMLANDLKTLRERAESLVAQLTPETQKIASIIDTTARTGGGTMPKSEIPSVGISIAPGKKPASTVAEALAKQADPVVGYVDSDRLVLDLRTVFPHQDPMVAAAIDSAIQA